jgi:ribosomal protein L29
MTHPTDDELEAMAANVDCLRSSFATLRAERDALKAENARLRRAADISATIANGALDPTAREATLRRDLARVRDELRAALQEKDT